METNTLIQYTIVAAIIALAILWALWKVLRKGKGSGACSGCALSEACSKPRKERREKAPECHLETED